MSVQTYNCHPERIAGFLDGSLNDSELAALEDHLGECSACQKLLGDQTTAAELWDKASRYLRDEQEEPEPLSGANDLLPTQDRAHTIEAVLASLRPTDDPEMLGRLGGLEVAGVIGAGAMGVVLKACDSSLDRTVAVKVLAPHLASSGAARKRFAREAKAAAAVLHPNVMAIHGVSNDESLPYLVMPYCRGASLQKRLDLQGPLPLAEILRIGSQIAAGLAAAHAQGLVHRDIKPANILLEEGVERVAITDFGLARAVDDATVTRTGVIAGTPQYMSPEQARGESIDQRSDLFSLGSVLYAMCTGRCPFRAETSYAVLRRITDEEPSTIRQINPDVPEWLCAIVAKLMSKRPEDRFESAQQVAQLLEDCLAHVQQPSSVPLPALHGERPSPSFRRRQRWTGPKVVAGTAIAFVTTLAGVLILLAMNQATVSQHSGLPKALQDRLAPLEGRLVIPSNASVKEFPDRYEITSTPWHTTTTLVDGDLASRAHRSEKSRHSNNADKPSKHVPHAEHKHDTPDADHSHKLTQTEYFADEGKLVVPKSNQDEVTLELIGNAGFEGDYVRFSAEQVAFHLGGANDRMILIGNARLANNDKQVLTADRITNKAEWTLLEGNARLRRKTPTGKSETISAKRLEMDHVAGTIKID